MKKILIAVILCITFSSIFSEAVEIGNLMGKVINAENNFPLSNVSVIIKELEKGVYTNEKGEYRIYDIPVGNYTVSFQLIGFKSTLKTDIIIKSNRTIFVNQQLNRQLIEIEGMTTEINYFVETEDKATSVINYSSEEIRRAPGSAGDVSRIMLSLPSVAKVNDQSNNLIVRGGNPMENTFFIDNIEIPNINHFPHQGSSGGPIGILNVDFIEDVNFSTGGFSAEYGDKLSSVMEIKFRDGNPTEFDGQIDFNWAGFGGIIEGPISTKSSAMLAIKRSYLEYVVDVFDVGTSIAPSYGDVQAKLTYEFNPLQKLTFLAIYADDHNSPDQQNAIDNYMSHYGNQDLYQGTFGVNWKSVWNQSLFSNTALSYTSNKYNEDFYETFTGDFAIKNRTWEREMKMRNINHKNINDNIDLNFGCDLKFLQHSYNNWLAATTNAIGDSIPEFILDDEIDVYKTGCFISMNVKISDKLSTTFGLRGDYFSFNENVNFAPRFSCRYQLSDLTSINGSYGIYYQNLPLLLLSQNETGKELQNPRAIHYIAGIEHLLSEDTRLVIEAYQKEYANFPMDPTQPGLFILDDDFFNYYESLTDTGIALSRGIEFIIQKKLAAKIYGLASAAYFRSRYKDLDKVWRNRNYDNRVILSMEGGYKPNPNWEFSMRWIYAGGVPYTPIDINESSLNQYSILDESRINAERYPDYHSMNVRIDKRFFLHKTNLVIYASVWNIYSQKNIAEYYWNDVEQTIDEVYQWTMLPIVGMEWEF